MWKVNFFAIIRNIFVDGKNFTIMSIVLDTSLRIKTQLSSNATTNIEHIGDAQDLLLKQIEKMGKI